MESDEYADESLRRDAATELRAAEQAAAAPYLDYPPTSWWEPWAVGLWCGAMTWLVGMQLRGEDIGWVIIAQPLLVLAMAGWVFWQARRHGALPSRLWGPQVPPEIRGAYRRYLVGVLVYLALIAALLGWTTATVAAVTAVPLGIVGFRLYDRDYRAAAERARVRLA